MMIVMYQGAEVVRLKDGYVVDPDSLSRKETRRLGYTVQIELREEKHSRSKQQLQLTSFDAGRRKTRKNSGLILGAWFWERCSGDGLLWSMGAKLTSSRLLFLFGTTDYISDRADELDVQLKKRFTVLGTICMFLGGLSFVFAVLFGEWGNEPPTVKKRH